MTALAHSTRIAVTVVIQDDTGRVASFLVALAALVGLLVQLGHFVAYVAGVVADVIDAVTFASRIWVIGFKSLAFGLGVNL